MGQLALFGRTEPPSFDRAFSRLERIVLADGAWLGLARGWLAGHEQVYAELLHRTPWRAERSRAFPSCCRPDW